MQVSIWKPTKANTVVESDFHLSEWEHSPIKLVLWLMGLIGGIMTIYSTMQLYKTTLQLIQYQFDNFTNGGVQDVDCNKAKTEKGTV